MLNQFVIIVPEIMLASLAIFMQVAGVCYAKYAQRVLTITMLSILGIIVYLLYFVPNYESGFSGSFFMSQSFSLIKALVLIFTLMSLLIYSDLMKISNNPIKIEFSTLLLLSTVGIFVSISAQDFIVLFCGLELQALSGYALAAFNEKKISSSEAGLKYFVLGALMSGLMLLGISFLYGFSGSLKFMDIKLALTAEHNIGLVVGVVLIFSTILFKLSAAPLHFWTPDVYEGSPISSVTYFSVAQKVGMLVVFFNIVSDVIGDYKQISTTLIKLVAIFSMVVGAFGAISQSSLKRLMAYSAILNIGYVLIAVCLNSFEGYYAAFLYLTIYVVGVIGFFACLVALFGMRSDDATFEDLKGIANVRKTIAATISIIMFSMIGIPPLAGFFGKYYVFYNAVKQGEPALAGFGVITSVVAAFYYLKVIKYMYFNQTPSNVVIIPTHKGLFLVTSLSLAFILLFLVVASYYLF